MMTDKLVKLLNEKNLRTIAAEAGIDDPMTNRAMTMLRALKDLSASAFDLRYESNRILQNDPEHKGARLAALVASMFLVGGN